MTDHKKTALPGLLAALLTLPFLFGCTTMNANKPEVTAGMKRVGVVSVAARTLTRQFTGLTVFTNEYEQMDVSIWNLDDHYENQIGDQLKRVHGREPVKAPFVPDEFFQVGLFLEGIDAPLFDKPTVDVKQVVNEYCTANNVDGIVLLMPSRRDDGRTTQIATPFMMVSRGLSGIVIHSHSGFAKRSTIHVVSTVQLIDCKTTQVIARRWLSMDQRDGMKKFFSAMVKPGDSMQGLPAYYIDAKTANTPLAQWTPETFEQTKSKLMIVANNAFPETMRSMFAPPTETGK